MLRRANHRTTLPKTRTKIPRGETCCKFVCLRGSVAAIATISAIINKINEISGSIASSCRGTERDHLCNRAQYRRWSQRVERDREKHFRCRSGGAEYVSRSALPESSQILSASSRAPHLPPRAARIELQRQMPQGRFPCASSHPPSVCRRYPSEPHQRPSQLPRTEMTLGTGGVTARTNRHPRDGWWKERSQSFKETAQTILVSAHGCMVCLAAAVMRAEPGSIVNAESVEGTPGEAALRERKKDPEGKERCRHPARAERNLIASAL